MAERSIADRVEILEQKVDSLEQLPKRITALSENVGALRVELQQFRGSNENEHSAMRAEIAQMHNLATKHADDIRNELIARFKTLEGRFNGVDQHFETIDQRFDGIDQRFDGVNGQFAQLRRELGEQLARIEARLPLPQDH